MITLEKIGSIAANLISIFIVFKIMRITIPVVLKWIVRIIFRFLIWLLAVANLVTKGTMIFGIVGLIYYFVNEFDISTITTFKEAMKLVFPASNIIAVVYLIYIAFDKFYELVNGLMVTTYAAFVDNFF